MTDYGVVPTGFSRKALPIVLDEIEAALITEFGADVIQSAESPFGQVNGIFADYVASLWELAEDVYQSWDVDQAESRRLDILGKLRLLRRATGEDDPSLRAAITNRGRARIDLQDLVRAVQSIDGVTYAQVFLNETNVPDDNLLPPGTICIAALGGDDEEIAGTMRQFIVPGISTYGNTYVSTTIDGYCRSITILRPILMGVSLVIKVKVSRDQFGCPPPAPVAIRDALLEDWAYGGRMQLLNGDNITAYRIRSALESRFPNVEFVSFTGVRDDFVEGQDEPGDMVSIGFIELATFVPENVVVDVI